MAVPLETSAKPTIILQQPRSSDLEKGICGQIPSSDGRLYKKRSWYAALVSGPVACYGQWRNRPEYDPRTDVRNIDACPDGYPKLAAFVDSDPNFMIYRRFGYLRTRLLLHHQENLRAMERQLDLVDRHDASDPVRQRLLCFQHADDNQDWPTRKELFAKLDCEFKTYDALLLRTGTLYQYENPTSRNQRSVSRLIWNDGQLAEPDRNYIHHLDDLLTLGGDKEHGWVHAVFEEAFKFTSRRLTRLLFQTRIQKAKTKDPDLAINLYAKARIDFFVAMVFTAIITGFLMGPVFVLYRCQSEPGMGLAAIMLGFTFSFAMLCQVCTTAKRHEIFAATAAYCAVLVVFVSQNTGSNTTTKAT